MLWSVKGGLVLAVAASSGIAAESAAAATTPAASSALFAGVFIAADVAATRKHWLI